jgi:tetratricopeptide (TPR) repeat protein
MLFIVLYSLIVILFFVASRYKVPMIPILATIAAAGLVSVINIVRMKRRREVITIAAAVVGTILLSTLPGPFCQEEGAFEAEFFQFVGIGMNKRGLNDRAIECFSEALRLKPDFNETYFHMGEALRGQGKISEAIEYYRKALQQKLDDTIEYIVHNNLGMALMKQGKMDEAIEHYREAIRLKPDYFVGHNNLGIALENQGKLDEAIEHYKEALRLKPDFSEALKNLTSALAQQRQSKSMVEP